MRALLVAIVLGLAGPCLAQSSLVGSYRLQGQTDGLQPTRALLEVEVVEGRLQVSRLGGRADRAPRVWVSREVEQVGDVLRVVYRTKGKTTHVGAAGRLQGQSGVVKSPGNVIMGTYRRAGRLLLEVLKNTTRHPPQADWTVQRAMGRVAGPSSLSWVETVVRNGAPRDRLDLVFLAEGYRAAEVETFRRDVRTAVGGLSRITPFREYWRYVNVHTVFVAAERSGLRTDDPAETVYSTRLNDRRARATCSVDRVGSAAGRAPGADAVIVLANDRFRSVAWRNYTVVSARCGDRLGRLVAHELGHLLGGLNDEYVEGQASNWDYLFANPVTEGVQRLTGQCANLTSVVRRELIPWSYWLSDDVPLPTPLGSGHTVGLFRGGGTQAQGWYRPSEHCLMGDSHTPGRVLCVVCREVLTLQLARHAYPATVRAKWLAQARCRLTVHDAIPSARRITWHRNGQQVASGPTYVVTSADLTLGVGALELRVEDQTSFVRRDPHNWLRLRFLFALEGSILGGQGLRIIGPTRVPHAVDRGDAAARRAARAVDR